MHDAFEAYIRHGKALAETKALIWDFPIDSEGYSNSGWNLTLLSGGTPPPIHYLRDLGADNKTLEYLNTSCTEMGMVPRNKQPLDLDWQNLIKAATCEQLLFKRSSTMHVINGIIRPLKVLATCCLEENIKPWELNADVINKAVTITRENQKSGQLSDTILGVVKNIIDTNHLAIASPLYPALSVKRQNLSSRDRRSKLVKSSEEVLAGLEKRKSQEKLPERRAFWELIRIVFTECPQSYVDALRFAAIQVMVITGLRIGEAVRLPADWKRTREYYDISGKPAGELGGYSQALMLRHFAEKQQAGDGVAFYENAQFVPDIFEEILTETLNNAARITQPLRETLKLQCETRRLLPWYQLSDLVPVSELYTRLTGNPFWLQLSEAETNSYIERYRKAYDPQILEHLSDYQATAYQTGDMRRLDMAMYIFFHRLVHSSSKNKLLNFRTENGSIYPPGRFKWNEVYLNIQELESHLTENLPTKVSDLTPTKLADSTTLQPWEYLFLIPKRALAEERNAGITDITRYYSVGISDQTLINLVLGEEKDNRISIFVTSHSPNFASIADLDSLTCLVDTDKGIETFAPRTIAFEKGKREKLKRYLDVTRAELFFARRVIFVEGAAEMMLVSVLADKAGFDLRKHAVSLISVEGLNFDSFLPLFGEKALKIPVSLITDADPFEKSDDGLESKPLYPALNDVVTVSDNTTKMKKSEDCLVKVFHGVKTLEYDLALHADNRISMIKALKELHPDIGKTVETEVDAAQSDAEKARALFSGMFERPQNNVQKGRFGQVLAQVFTEKDSKCVVPSYYLGYCVLNPGYSISSVALENR